MIQKYSGSVLVVIAALLWSLDGLLRRQLFSLPPAVVVFWEHILGFAVLLPILIFTFREFKKLSRRQWLAIAGVSLLSGALGTVLYTAALLQVHFIPFSVVVLLQQLNPIFAITAAALLLKEPVSKKFLGLAALALAAAYFVSFPDLQVHLSTGSGTLVAALLAIGAAASWGASTAFSKYSLKGTSPLHITAARFGLTPLFALAIVFLTGGGASLVAIRTVQWQYLVAITFSTGLIALIIYYFGLKRVPASRSALLELVWPLSAAVIGYGFLGDRLSPTQILGAIVLIGTTLVVARDSSKLERSQLAADL